MYGADELTTYFQTYAPSPYNQYEGVNVGGKTYNNLRYADDTALLAGNEKELSGLKTKIDEVGKQFGMKININNNGCQQAPKFTQSKNCHRWTTY